MHTHWIARLLLCAVLTAPLAVADTVVIPNNCAGSPGPSNNDIPFNNGNMRYQQVFAADQFGGRSGLVTQLAYRVDESEGSNFVSDPFPVRIWLSHTTAAPQALSNRFDDNAGPDKTLVFDSNLSLASAGTGDFDIIVNLDDVFTYNGAGNLLLEMQFLDWASTATFDAAGTGIGEGGTPWTDRLYADGADAEFGESTGDDGLVTQFTIVPEPAAGLPVLLLAALRRR